MGPGTPSLTTVNVAWVEVGSKPMTRHMLGLGQATSNRERAAGIAVKGPARSTRGTSDTKSSSVPTPSAAVGSDPWKLSVADEPAAVTSYWWRDHASPAPGACGPSWSTRAPSKRTSIRFCAAVVPGRAAKAKASEYEAPGVVATVWLTPLTHVVFSSTDWSPSAAAPKAPRSTSMPAPHAAVGCHPGIEPKSWKGAAMTGSSKLPFTTSEPDGADARAPERPAPQRTMADTRRGSFFMGCSNLRMVGLTTPLP